MGVKYVMLVIFYMNRSLAIQIAILNAKFYKGKILHKVKKKSQEEPGASVIECLAWEQGVAGSSLTGGTGLCPWARHFILCLVLLKPTKTSPGMTEKLLTGA